MTPKEKAQELVEKFNDYTIQATKYYANGKMEECKEDAKECALIAVDECLKILNVWSAFNMPKSSQVIFYEEVKQEIENL
jgi:hypothetical protein